MRLSLLARSAPLAAVALAPAGCNHTARVSDGPVRRGPAEVRLESSSLVVRGRQADLCVVMPPGATYSAVTGLTLDRAGQVVEITARLLRPDGRGVDLGRTDVAMGRDLRLCFSPDGQLPQGTRYRAVALRAADTLTVPAVTWWSGEHTKLLP